MSYLWYILFFAFICYVANFLFFYFHTLVLFICTFLRRINVLGDNYLRLSYKFNMYIYRLYSQIWNGYEIHALTAIPDKPCIFVAYHGAMPVDMFYFICRLHEENIKLYSVAATHFFKYFGFLQITMDYYHLLGWATSTDDCAALLKAGNHILIMPGGVHEAQTTHHSTYQLEWKERTGFAKLALHTNTPIVPIFTTNINENFRSPRWVYTLWRWLFPNAFLPYLPPVGGWPVKLVTHLGDPIEPDQRLTPQELRKKVEDAIYGLMRKHQRIPGDIFQALLDRFRTFPYSKNK